AAGREGHDDLDGASRIIAALCERDARYGHARGESEGAAMELATVYHGVFSDTIYESEAQQRCAPVRAVTASPPRRSHRSERLPSRPASRRPADRHAPDPAPSAHPQRIAAALESPC